MGSSESVKFADAKSAFADNGGRPCLCCVSKVSQMNQGFYLTKSTRLKACRGLLASLATSSSLTEALDCD